MDKALSEDVAYRLPGTCHVPFGWKPKIVAGAGHASQSIFDGSLDIVSDREAA
jgi:hypothetical protein